MKKWLIESITIIVLCCWFFFAGFYSAFEMYNQDYTEQQLKLLVYICSQNDGIKSFRRNTFDPSRVTAECKNTAVFNKVQFKFKDFEDGYPSLVSR